MTFHLEMPPGLNEVTDNCGNPTKAMGSSLDCWFIQFKVILTLYLRVLWNLAMPEIYFLAFCFFLLLFSFIFKIKVKLNLIWNALIYLIIYF